MSTTTGTKWLTARKTLHERNHPDDDDCPACGKSCWHCGLIYIVYTYEVCTCDAVSYPHLVVRPWHRSCFSDREAAS